MATVATDQITVEYQDATGAWIAAATTVDSSAEILRGMQDVSRSFPGKRIRAVQNGRIVDIL